MQHGEMSRLRVRRSNTNLIRVTQGENKESGEEAMLSQQTVMKNFSELMEGMNLQIKPPAQCPDWVGIWRMSHSVVEHFLSRGQRACFHPLGL